MGHQGLEESQGVRFSGERSRSGAPSGCPSGACGYLVAALLTDQPPPLAKAMTASRRPGHPRSTCCAARLSRSPTHHRSNSGGPLLPYSCTCLALGGGGLESRTGRGGAVLVPPKSQGFRDSKSVAEAERYRGPQRLDRARSSESGDGTNQGCRSEKGFTPDLHGPALNLFGTSPDQTTGTVHTSHSGEGLQGPFGNTTRQPPASVHRSPHHSSTGRTTRDRDARGWA